MKIHNLWVNQSGEPVASLNNIDLDDKPINEILDKVTEEHPEWTSLVVTIVRENGK